MRKKNAIFVSYRREDTRWTTRAAVERLAAHFGKEKVFIDVENIEGGHDFLETINDALAQCGALLTFIGDNWLVDKQGRRRLDDPKDIVRKEITIALKKDLLVVPVLVDEARMPSKQDLPSNLELLYRCNAIPLRHADFRRDIEVLIDLLGRELNLPMAAVPWLDMPWQERKDNVHSAQWLRYWHRHAKFVGRREEMGKLKEFFESEERFSWYAITGPGGVGKSRLALESLLVLEADWHSGFLKEEDRKSLEWRYWRPQLKTAIVVDYAAQDPDWLVEWLNILCCAKFECPVRVLLIERATHLREGEKQLWWKRLTTGRGSALNRVETFHKLDAPIEPQSLEIAPIDEGDQRNLLRSFLQAANCECKMPPEEDIELWASMNQLTQGGRPLYIGMVAAAIAAEGVAHIRHWNQGDLLQRTLEREREFWIDATHLEPDDKMARHAVRLIAIATDCGGLSFRDEDTAHHVKGCLDGAHLLDKDMTTRDLYSTAATMTGFQSYSLEPDLLGEFFLVTQQWSIPSAEEVDELAQLRSDLRCAWDINPLGFCLKISRVIADFPRDSNTTVRWLSYLIEDRSKQVDKEEWLALVTFIAMDAYGTRLHRSVLEQVYECTNKILPSLPENAVFQCVGGLAAYNLGVLLAEQGDLDGAKAAYDRGIELGHGSAAYNLGVLLAEQGDLDGAKAAYDRGVELGHGSAAYNLGVLLTERGDLDGAKAAYDRGVELGDGAWTYRIVILRRLY